MQEKIRRLIALDRTLAYAIAARIWQSLSGPITLVLLLSTLDEKSQGIYYGFAHLVGLQAMFDLGLTGVLITQFGHARGRLGSQSDFAGIQAEPHKPASETTDLTLIHLLRGAEIWYAWLAVVSGVVVLGLGSRLLTLNESENTPTIPFVLLVASSFMTFALSPRLAALEGVGFRESVYRSRFWQMVFGSFSVWAALLLGGGVWALTVAAAVQLVMTWFLIFVERNSYFKSVQSAWSSKDASFWFRRVLPFQWRSGVLAIAHYLSSQVFVLILLTFGQPIEAGRMGATLSIIAAVQALAQAWVQTKLPLVASHHGKGDREIAGELWRRTAILSTSLLVVGLSCFVLILFLFEWLGLSWQRRFVPAGLIGILSLGVLANHLVSIQSYYVLARGSLPLFAASFLGCLATAAAVWLGGFSHGLLGVTVGYAVGAGLILLPLHTLAYRRYRASSK